MKDFPLNFDTLLRSSGPIIECVAPELSRWTFSYNFYKRFISLIVSNIIFTIFTVSLSHPQSEAGGVSFSLDLLDPGEGLQKRPL